MKNWDEEVDQQHENDTSDDEESLEDENKEIVNLWPTIAEEAVANCRVGQKKRSKPKIQIKFENMYAMN